MKILCVTPLYPEPTDPAFGSFVARLNEALRQYEHLEVVVVRRRPGERGWLSYLHLAWDALKLAQKDRHFDLVHAHYLGAVMPIAWVVSILVRAPVVFTAHGSDIETATPMLRAAQRFFLRRSAGFQAVSQYLLGRARERLGCLPRHTLAQNMGFDASQFLSRPAKTLGNPWQLVMVGRLVPEKGWCEALDALAALLRNGFSVVLQAYGGTDTEWLKQEISKRRLDAHVIVHGVCEPSVLAAVYGNADAVLVPSHREGFGLTGLEAMASGAAVISSGVGGLGDYMVHRHNAMVVNNRGEDLAQAVVEVMRNAELRTQLQNNGRQTAEKYSLEKVARAVHQWYRQVLSNAAHVR